MDKYEYLKISPDLDALGDVRDGYESSTEKTKPLFGSEKTKTVMIPKYITIGEWLNKKGDEGWELVTILRNPLDYSLSEFYFKRKKLQ